VSAPNVSAFLRARVAAAQPLSAGPPIAPVAVTPELIAALQAGVLATAHDLSRAQRLELDCVLLQLRLADVRRRMS
jgi:hypothetical protein